MVEHVLIKFINLQQIKMISQCLRHQKLSQYLLIATTTQFDNHEVVKYETEKHILLQNRVNLTL